jgi:hypothetical protein
VIGALVAALFVSRKGPYWGRSDVDARDADRNAKRYRARLPVVAHPPCGRWCKLAKAVQGRWGYRVGDDAGCFAFALRTLRRVGGVLEHPAWSMAWRAFGLFEPTGKGWVHCIDGTWVCEVSQAAYGCRARKLTWLLYIGRNPPVRMDWSRPMYSKVVGFSTNRCSRPMSDRLSSDESSRTPPRFADALISLAANCGGAP